MGRRTVAEGSSLWPECSSSHVVIKDTPTVCLRAATTRAFKATTWAVHHFVFYVEQVKDTNSVMTQPAIKGFKYQKP